ncbi:MAG: YegP family protein [Acidobacteriota bacterium]
MGAYFQIFKDSAGEFRFNLRAPNHEKILHSEGYVQKQGCLNGIASVKANAPARDKYESFTDAAGMYRFRLRARNNEIIGTSEAYVTPQGRDNGIAAVMQYAPSATIEDLPA